jgi:dipeptidyl aminopeptidase/acylaminoacyl peptidase
MKRDVGLSVDGLKIVGQLYLPEDVDPPHPGVILCHGIPTGKADPTDGGYPLLAKTIAGQGFVVLAFNFRGAGESEGDFDVVGWSHDLKAAIEFMWDLPDIDDSHIALVGFSAGASISIYVAAQDKRVAAVAACACPCDFNAISDSGNPQLNIDYFRKIGIIRNPNYPPSLRNWLSDFRKVNALHSVADIAPRPLFLVHAAGDNVVPSRNAEMLFNKAGHPKQILIIEGAEHRLRRNETAVKAIIAWLKEQD